MKNLIPLMYLLVCLVGCTATKVEHKPNMGGSVGVATEVEEARKKATVEYWMKLEKIVIAYNNAQKPYEKQLDDLNGQFGLLTIRRTLQKMSAVSKEAAKLTQEAAAWCRSLSTRNVDPEAQGAGEALIAYYDAGSGVCECMSKMDLSTMISESLGGYSANLIDGLCSTIAQVLQALRGTSPTPVITPLSDQANKGSTAEKLGTAKNRLQKARAAFTETERKSRGVLSNRYNVDFIPL